MFEVSRVWMSLWSAPRRPRNLKRSLRLSKYRSRQTWIGRPWRRKTKRWSIPETGRAELILTIVQARVSSSRLPEKVMRLLMGEPMLARMIERVRRAQALDAIVVGTSTDTSDDRLVSMCTERGITCERGSLDDVLDRYYRIAEPRRPEYVVRLTGDCPLIDPGIIDAVVGFAIKGDYDYASNTLKPTFPDGLDVEVISFTALERAWHEARLASEREHVTPYIKKCSAFHRGSFEHPRDLSAFRWTVDEPQDFALVQQIYEALLPINPEFGMSEILEYVRKHPELTSLNSHITRDEGYTKSLHDDMTDGGRRR